MKRSVPVKLALFVGASLLLTATVVSAQDVAAAEPPSALVVRAIPEEDPGPPFYARLGMQRFHSGDWLVVVFYRDPSCVPPDFDLSQTYDFPGEAGPGAFACDATVEGHTLTEPDAPATRFPWLALLEGRGAVPVWFVPWGDYQDLAVAGPVTVDALSSLGPLVGSAEHYHETLHPRTPGHKIDAVASGVLEDGRRFRYGVAERDGDVADIFLELE